MGWVLRNPEVSCVSLGEFHGGHSIMESVLVGFLGNSRHWECGRAGSLKGVVDRRQLASGSGRVQERGI